MIASGAKPSGLVMHVRGLTSAGYGWRTWDPPAGGNSLIIAGALVYSPVPELPPDPHPDKRITEILESLSAIKKDSAQWVRAIPWLIGLLVAIAVALISAND